MSVVRDFCGHGLGRLFHDEPNIVHFGRPGEGIVLRPGMFFTVEPMINLGRPHVKVLSDGWTAVTRDRSLSAQFEHTVAVTETGVEIFTLSPQGLDQPPYQLRPHVRTDIPTTSSRGKRGRRDMPDEQAELARRLPKRRIITAIASGCASASSRPAPTRSATTSCSS